MKISSDFNHLITLVNLKMLNANLTDFSFSSNLFLQPPLSRSLKSRSIHQRCSMKIGVLRNFVKFTRKRLCQGLFFKKEALAQVFSCEIKGWIGLKWIMSHLHIHVLISFIFSSLIFQTRRHLSYICDIYFVFIKTQKHKIYLWI